MGLAARPAWATQRSRGRPSSWSWKGQASLRMGMQAGMRSHFLAWNERHWPGCLPCAQQHAINASAYKMSITSAAAVLVYQAQSQNPKEYHGL